MSKLAVAAAALVAVMSLALAASALRAEEAPDLDGLIRIALSQNPELQASRARVEALQARIPQANVLDDPRLEVDLMNVPIDSFKLGMDPMSGVTLTLKQMVPYRGKLRLMGEMAAKEAEAAADELADKQNEVASQVKKAYYDLYSVRRTKRITQEIKGLLGDMEKIAETRYSVGQGIQQDVLKAQTEQSGMINDLLMLDQQEKSALARVNYLLNREPVTPVPTPKEITRRSFHLDQDKLRDSAIANRPMLKALRAMVEMKKVGRELALRDYKPDFDYMAGVMIRQGMAGMDMFSLGVMMNLPIRPRQKQDRKVDETKAEIAESEAQYDAMKNEIFFMVRDLTAMLEASESQLSLLKTGILPQASQSLSSARSGYQVGNVDFEMLLDNLMTLLKYETSYEQLAAGYEKSLAELEWTVGGLEQPAG